MKRHSWIIRLVSVVTLLGMLSGGMAVAAEPTSPPTAMEMADPVYNTIITVNSGTDPNDSKSESCATEEVCTLRRAIVQARLATPPVLIQFDIPEDPAEGYNSALGIWEIQVNTTDLDAFRRLTGQITIDGTTQPGGRDEGPTIFVIGPGTGQKTGFVVGDIAGEDEIIIRGLGLQNFATHMYINTNSNLIEDCWFGLSTDGMNLTSGNINEPEGGTAIALMSSADNNVIHNNRFAGFFGASVAIRGNDNVFTANWVGMRADGIVPLPAQFQQHPCSGSTTWAGGSGVTVEGNRNQIGGPDPADGNRFAGLYLNIFGLSEQPFAIEFKGATNNVIVQNNIIGLDGADNPIGICGRGLKLSNGPQGTRVVDNVFVETGLSAILMNRWDINGNTLRGNIIRRESPWPEPQGDSTFPEDAIAYGGTVPSALQAFQPAAITGIDGVNVTGVSGTSENAQVCAHCTIEIFLDDTDAITEALQSLAVVTAGANGNWTATLSAPLEAGQGLRTMSTVPDEWTIDDLAEGTTSNLSILYGGGFTIYLPLVVRH